MWYLRVHGSTICPGCAPTRCEATGLLKIMAVSFHSMVESFAIVLKVFLSRVGLALSKLSGLFVRQTLHIHGLKSLSECLFGSVVLIPL